MTIQTAVKQLTKNEGAADMTDVKIQLGKYRLYTLISNGRAEAC